MDAFEFAPVDCRWLGGSTTYLAGPAKYAMLAFSGLAGTSIRPPRTLPERPGTSQWGSSMSRFEVEKITA